MLGDVIFWSRIGIALLYVLLMVFTYLLCRDLGLSRKASIFAWAFASFTIPIAFYSYSIYPEVAAGLLCVLSLRAMVRWDELKRLNPLLAGACLAALPWLGLKYAVLSVVLGVGFLVFILRGRAPILRSVGSLALVPIISLLLFAGYLYALYGSFSPSVIYTGTGEGAKTAANINWQSAGRTDGPIAGFVRMMLLYFFDQRDGILFYSPFYLFAIAGIIIAIGKLKTVRTISLAFLAYWAVYAFSHWSGGHAPPGRPLMAVSWILVIGLAYGFENIRGWFPDLVKWGSATIAVCFTALFTVHNFLAYHVILAHTETHGNNFLASVTFPFDLTVLFPNLVNPHDIHPVASVIILTLAVVVVLLLIRFAVNNRGRTTSQFPAPVPALLAVVIVPVLFFTLAYFNAEIFANEEMQGQGAVRLVFKDDNTYGFEPDMREGAEIPAFWTQGGTTSRVNVVMGRRPTSLVVEVLSLVPQPVTIHVEGTTYQINCDSPNWNRITIPGNQAARWLHRALFRIRISSATGYVPAEHGENDTRNLGCRIAIIAEFPQQ
jgi:hypothetical protein